MFNSNPKIYKTLDDAIADQESADATKTFLKGFWTVYASAVTTILVAGYVRAKK